MLAADKVSSTYSVGQTVIPCWIRPCVGSLPDCLGTPIFYPSQVRRTSPVVSRKPDTTLAVATDRGYVHPGRGYRLLEAGTAKIPPMPVFTAPPPRQALDSTLMVVPYPAGVDRSNTWPTCRHPRQLCGGSSGRSWQPSSVAPSPPFTKDGARSAVYSSSSRAFAVVAVVGQ